MVTFKKYVEVGRVALIRSGRFRGKVCAIVDIVDQNRVLVHGPRSGVPRQDVTLKRILLTGMKLRLNRACATSELANSWEHAKVTEKWKRSCWGRALVAQKKKRAMTDYDRFKLMRARQARNKIIKQEIIFLKKKYEPKKMKKHAEWVAKLKARQKVKQTPLDPEALKLRRAENLKAKLLFRKKMRKKKKKQKEEKKKQREEREAKAKAAKEAGPKPRKKVPKLRGKKAAALQAKERAKKIATMKAKGVVARSRTGVILSKRMRSYLRGPRMMVLHKKQIRSMILRGTRSSLPKRKKLEKPEVKPHGKDKKPGDKKPGDKKPGEKKPGEKKPGEKKPGEKKPGEKKPGDKKPGDKKPGDKKPGDKKPGDKKPGDKKPGDKKPRDKKPAEKSGDKKPGDEKSGDRKPGAEPDSKP